MPIYLGNNEVSLFKGSNEISEGYLGSTLVYQNFKGLYPGATVQNKTANAGSYGAFWTNVPSGTNYNSTFVYIEVDLTGINSITINGSWQGGGGNSFTGVVLMSSSQINNSNARYPYYYIGQGSSGTYYTKMQRGNFTTVTWDVSSYNGNWYIGIGCYNNPGNGTARAEITEILINS